MMNDISKLYQDRDWLFDQYWNLGKSQKEIAEDYCVKKGVIYYWMKKFNIKARSISEANKGRKFIRSKKERLIRYDYITFLKPDHPRADEKGYVFEHILIVEKELGRYLNREKEVVHHINMNKGDNNIENLWVSNKQRHYHAHKSYNKCCQKLMENGGIVKFDREKGEYYILLNYLIKN